MGTYRKKPVDVQAWPVADLMHAAEGDWKSLPDAISEAYERGDVIFARDHIIVKTLEGDHRADPDDMMIQGVQGELYPCKPDIFKATYDVVLG